MFTSSSSTRSSPQDQNLISGWPTGHDAVWRNSVDGFHWNVSHVFSSWTVTLVPRRAGSDVARGWGLLELVCWPTRGAHLLWQPAPSLQRKRAAVSHSTAFVYDPRSSGWRQQWVAEGKFPYRTNKYCVSGDSIVIVCDSELFRFKDRVKKKKKKTMSSFYCETSFDNICSLILLFLEWVNKGGVTWTDFENYGFAGKNWSI